MQTFTGAEIAALISEGCIIGSHRVFSRELERQLATMPFVQRMVCGYKHWIRGVYLITGVNEDDGRAGTCLFDHSVPGAHSFIHSFIHSYLFDHSVPGAHPLIHSRVVCTRRHGWI